MKFEKVSFEVFKKSLIDNNLYMGEEVTLDLYNRVKLPCRATKGSAGYDFMWAVQNLHINPNKTYTVPTGIKVELDDDKFLGCYPRSSYGFKYGFTLENTVGIIDSDYYNNKDNEGHINCSFRTSKEMVLENGNKFMQGIIQPFYLAEDDTTKTKRKSGIGSTGK